MLTECYLPGWDDGPDGEFCELGEDHEGQHAAYLNDLDDPESGAVYWDVTWVVDEEDFPFGD